MVIAPVGKGMISSVRRPLFREAKRPSEVRKLRMTVAMGMLCAHGAVIAADTRVVASDGRTSTARKIRIERTPSGGQIVAAFSSDDVDAATTLLNDLFEEIISGDPATLRDFEMIVRSVMAKWPAAYMQQRPYVEFIMGVSLRSPPRVSKGVIGGGVGLCLCRPPHAIVLKNLYNLQNQSTYFGIGAGTSVTDPIYETIFGPFNKPKTCLKQLAYMMYRAKRDYASCCGGVTNAVFLREKEPAAFEIEPSDMEAAEMFGHMLDQAFNMTASAILSPSIEQAQAMLGNLGGYMEIMSGYRNLRFLTADRQEICDDGIVRKVGVQE